MGKTKPDHSIKALFGATSSHRVRRHLRPEHHDRGCSYCIPPAVPTSYKLVIVAGEATDTSEGDKATPAYTSFTNDFKLSRVLATTNKEVGLDLKAITIFHLNPEPVTHRERLAGVEKARADRRELCTQERERERAAAQRAAEQRDLAEQLKAEAAKVAAVTAAAVTAAAAAVEEAHNSRVVSTIKVEVAQLRARLARLES